jgi:hypothetical protein
VRVLYDESGTLENSADGTLEIARKAQGSLATGS